MTAPPVTTDMSSEKPAGVKRRDFLKVVGATSAATTMVGCSSESVEKLIPYLVSPDETVPGVSTYYATTCRECSVACGVIAETRDGRTIKLEGNPEQPANRGALCAKGQSALQGCITRSFRNPMIRRTVGSRRLRGTKLSRSSARSWEKRVAARPRGVHQSHESGNFPAFLNTWLASQGMPAAISIDPDADHAAIAANRQTYGLRGRGSTSMQRGSCLDRR